LCFRARWLAHSLPPDAKSFGDRISLSDFEVRTLQVLLHPFTRARSGETENPSVSR
jgi:hypothetical protein